MVYWTASFSMTLDNFNPNFSRARHYWMFRLDALADVCAHWAQSSLITITFYYFDLLLTLNQRAHVRVVQGHSDYSSSESLAGATPPSRTVTTKIPTAADQHLPTQDGSHEPGYRVWPVAPPHPLWSDPEFLDNFCTVFVSFVSQLNRKIRDLRLVRVCCSLNTASKCTKTHHFGGQKLFFLGRDLAHPPYPPTLDAYGAFSPPPYWNAKYATGYDNPHH